MKNNNNEKQQTYKTKRRILSFFSNKENIFGKRHSKLKKKQNYFGSKNKNNINKFNSCSSFSYNKIKDVETATTLKQRIKTSIIRYVF